MTTAGNGTTGRYLVLLEDDSVAAGTKALNQVAGIHAASTAEAGVDTMTFNVNEGVVLHQLGVAVVNADEEQAMALARAVTEPGPIAVLEQERRVYAIAAPAPADDHDTLDEAVFTWGLQAVGAQLSMATGKGIRIAVLDTGFDLNHPDFANREVESSSFVPGQEVQDGHGHGTHCIGSACGPREPENSPGYGVAYESEIFAGKVLSNEGSGADGGILSGIAWAVSNNCPVISMSLGARTRPGDPYSRTYERVAARALEQGTLIIAAAGNESKRQNGVVAPVGHPANCPSIMAVGAVDVGMKMAWFSCGTVDDVGAVDLVGPGVDVHSSWPMPLRHNRISGTSMATPHVAGVAALIAQATGARGLALWARLAQTSRRLPLPSTDVGSGLVQAP